MRLIPYFVQPHTDANTHAGVDSYGRGPWPGYPTASEELHKVSGREFEGGCRGQSHAREVDVDSRGGTATRRVRSGQWDRGERGVAQTAECTYLNA
ncbi:hypothetical protein L227DRAFT_582028 [Lentinus tigrinus ALCF2SS1-6]|uniref:Uncharacterized protein n=1 Tax=Lentinus tigrinus ALCF2SS1-6 TaxID=1328759 RepID=A0A5C2RLX8_9APHY|nr:hypothetical protein L227DRAFT_582028 [Lentinus tigrinus ALCF2SS1-6]